MNDTNKQTVKFVLTKFFANYGGAMEEMWQKEWVGEDNGGIFDEMHETCVVVAENDNYCMIVYKVPADFIDYLNLAVALDKIRDTKIKLHCEQTGKELPHDFGTDAMPPLYNVDKFKRQDMYLLVWEDGGAEWFATEREAINRLEEVTAEFVANDSM